MNKYMKTIKITFIICFLISSLSIINLPRTSAIGDIYNCTSIIDIDYNHNLTKEALLPINMTLNIPITVNYRVEGYYEEYIPDIYTNIGQEVFIYVEIFNTPSWCEAAITPSFILLPATSEGVSKNLNLSIQINQNAKAFAYGNIAIEFKVEQMGAITGEIFYKYVSFQNAYFPMLNFNTPEGTSKSVTPGEIADFDLEIENLGNSLTNVSITVIEAPDDWTVGVPENILVDSANSNNKAKKTVKISISPSYSTGYHNEREIIKLAIKPASVTNKSLIGQEYYVTFVVKSKGYSTPGFELPLLIIGLLIVVFISKKGNLNFKGGNKK